jgi:hypothetical protein
MLVVAGEGEMDMVALMRRDDAGIAVDAIGGCAPDAHMHDDWMTDELDVPLQLHGPCKVALETAEENAEGENTTDDG